MHPTLQTHRGTLAVQKMVEYAPSTGGLALWVKHCDVDVLPALTAPGAAPSSVAQPPLSAANDGRTIFYAPPFDALPLPRQIGLVAHQVLHIALRHAQRAQALERLLGQVDQQLFNVCADAIVNSTLGHLSWLELPPDWVTLEGLLSSVLHREQNPAAALLEWDLERLYRTIDDRRFRSGTGGRGSSASGRSTDRAGRRSDPRNVEDEQRPSDTGATGTAEDGPRASRVRWLGENQPRDLLPADGESRPERDAEEAREWRERLIRAHAGDGAHSMLRELIADLPKVRTPWEHLLRTLLTRGLARSPDQSWSRPSRSYLANQGRSGAGRRMPWEPGKSASRAVPRLVVMVDLSGSIEPALLERFAGEIEAMSRRLEAGLTIVAGDCRVSGVAHFEPGLSNLRELGFEGGGGTDFTPLLKEAERHAPDIGVFLTDLDGPADYKPGFPVIWAVPVADADTPHPFGRKLVLE
jgi:predicted metal-dependent peptidase